MRRKAVQSGEIEKKARIKIPRRFLCITVIDSAHLAGWMQTNYLLNGLNCWHMIMNERT